MPQEGIGIPAQYQGVMDMIGRLGPGKHKLGGQDIGAVLQMLPGLLGRRGQQPSYQAQGQGQQGMSDYMSTLMSSLGANQGAAAPQPNIAAGMSPQLMQFFQARRQAAAPQAQGNFPGIPFPGANFSQWGR